VRGCHERLDFRRAAAETRALWVAANSYIQEQAPWAALTSEPARAAVATRAALNLLRLCAAVSWSIIPTLATRVLVAVGEPGVPSWPSGPAAAQLEARKGWPITRVDPPVGKLTAPAIWHLQQRFGGR